MEKTKLMEVRKQLKKKKPDFVRSDYGKKARLAKKWHRPKGITNKMRLKKRGYRIHISSGYRTPVLLRGLSKNGLQPIVINTLSDLENLNKKTQTGIVSSTLGQRKKAEIVKKAKEMQIVLQNVNNFEKYLKSVEKNMQLRKSKKAEVVKKKQEKVKQAEAKAKAKEEEEKKKQEEKKQLSTEEKAKKEEEDQKQVKQEQDKVLTQKQ